MTERNPTPASATLVAIDISKHRHEVLIEAPGHHRRRRLTILSTRADEPLRVCRRLLLLRGWSHDEENITLFP
jgi:hypothetical protein